MSTLTTLPGLAQSLAPETDLTRSRAHCRQVVRCRAGNFYHGMRLVPEPKRSAIYALYAWLREADDLADDGGEPDEKQARIERFWDTTVRALAGGKTDGSPLWPAFRNAALAYRLPLTTLREHVSGQLLDQRKTRYDDFGELYDYCRRVASTVGLLCIQVWGHDEAPVVRQLAEWRGVAFQLTNILRDVREDASLGRVYLPGCELSPRQILEGKTSPSCLGGVVARAREFYERSRPLEQHVHEDGRACLWAMTQIYYGVFRLIERDPGRVLRPGRVSLAGWKKAWIAMRAVTA